MATRENKKHGHQNSAGAAPLTGQRGSEIQTFETIVPLPIGLDESACRESASALNQLLADTISLSSLYKKHHWQVAGPTFYPLHQLFDKHYTEQNALVDEIAERIQLLGGVSVAMAPDVAEMTRVERPPRGREPVPVQLSRLLDAHALILEEARECADAAERNGDDGTNDLVVSQIIRTNELQVWFLSQHLVDVPTVDVRASHADRDLEPVGR